jgi:hypothetical protein
MQNIETLMKELNLGDEIISNTLLKIDFICTKNGYREDVRNLQALTLTGNGDGNGNN